MRKILYSSDRLINTPIGVTDGIITILEEDNKKVDEMIKKHHYSHKTTKNRFKSFTVNCDKGYLQLGYGIRPNMKHTISDLITKDNYCEFDRMWLSDDLPKFSETKTIGLLLYYIRRIYTNILFIITYADGSVGNTGVIYKASNALSIGSIPVDFYILPSGERIHPVTMWHRHKTRALGKMQEIYPGIKHIKEGRQYRFLYILDKKIKKKVQKQYDLLKSNRTSISNNQI